MNQTALDLLNNIHEALTNKALTPATRNKILHETLVITCAEGLKGTHYGFGDLNSQLESLIRILHIPAAEANALRKARRDSNRSRPLLPEDLQHDAAALEWLVRSLYSLSPSPSPTESGESFSNPTLFGSLGFPLSVGEGREEAESGEWAAGQPVLFGFTAKTVLAAGRDLWRYYHAQPDARPDASFYDIRLHFQGCRTTKSGKVQMNATSPDEEYTRLIAALRSALKDLAKAIEPKIYAYGFLV